MHEIVTDNISSEYIKVYEIPIRIRVTSNDNWIDIELISPSFLKHL